MNVLRNLIVRNTSQCKSLSYSLFINHNRKLNKKLFETPMVSTVQPISGRFLMTNTFSKSTFAPISIQNSQNLLRPQAGAVFCSNKAEKMPEQTEEKLTAGQKLKRIVKVYGPVGLVFHVTMSLAMLGGVYSIVSMGVDLVAVLEKLGISRAALENNKMVSGGGTFLLSYAIYKVFSPLRMFITAGATPVLVRHLRKIGWIKPR